MKKILILGGSGMLGHKMYQVLSANHDTHVSFRSFDQKIADTKIFDKMKVITDVDVFNYGSVEKAISDVKPHYVINCIGIIKQLKESTNSIQSIYINSLFPHLLSDTCDRMQCRLIQISTDCVYSGKKGNYREEDNSDAYDLYGKTKYLGEVNNLHSLTIRTSIIGHELFSSLSLVDWFLSNAHSTIKGFVNAIYTGLPTIVLSEEINNIIASYPDLHGLYQISSNKISKYDLLHIIKNVYNLKIEINPYEDFVNDKSLDCSKYISATHYTILDWNIMVERMYHDYIKSNYQRIKNV